MALEVDPSRKIQPRSRGDLRHPGTCACCGGSDPERTYIDFGIYFDYEGTVYICDICFREAVQVMGFFTPEEVLEQIGQLNKLLEENAALKTELEHARPILDAVANLTGPTVTLDSGISKPSDLVVPEGDEGQESSDEGTTDGESEVTESAVSTGRSNASGTKPRNRSNPVIQ
jgi:hypothetical protein